MQTRRHLLQASLALAGLPAFAQTNADAAAEAAIKTALEAAHRSPANRARDGARNPLPTLRFFDLRPTQSVVELSPGAGWYTEILAPLLRERGRYYAGQFARDSAVEGERRARTNLEARLARTPELYDRVSIVTMPGVSGTPEMPAAGGVDRVLTFRNVHNWISDGTLDGKLAGCFAMLKPGGVLGVVDHRATPGASLEVMKKSGYVTEAYMEERARAAGFVLAGKSEVNANPKDTRDHPSGVWTLPPTFTLKDVDREKYAAIGESDRFTHRYEKPRA